MEKGKAPVPTAYTLLIVQNATEGKTSYTNISTIRLELVDSEGEDKNNIYIPGIQSTWYI